MLSGQGWVGHGWIVNIMDSKIQEGNAGNAPGSLHLTKKVDTRVESTIWFFDVLCSCRIMIKYDKYIQYIICKYM